MAIASAGAAERLVHEAADGARAAAAPGAAAETAIDPASRACPLRRDGGADILIAQHIARTNDHGALLLSKMLARSLVVIVATVLVLS